MGSARQRTYEAAYWRTALGQLSFALIVLSIFQSAVYSIGDEYFLSLAVKLMYSVILGVREINASCGNLSTRIVK